MIFMHINNYIIIFHVIRVNAIFCDIKLLYRRLCGIFRFKSKKEDGMNRPLIFEIVVYQVASSKLASLSR